ncbi:AAA domain-containing protein [Kribbella amoyensis]|uniref:AAA domain-containing protein n=1 Tax=Kribbella amoyensis TaxID=996641 RepID=A0A561B3E1_9ACTN|nr:AAA family ATPase [Kribbella amoyensis]TWD73375.1 AAA domain-containing protein [Kribbella amoyensis]
MTPRAVLLTGGDGVGKTTVGQAIARLLTSDHHITAVVDLDAIAQFGPPRPSSGGLRFHDRLRVRNLTAVWPTYREAGAEYLVVSGHVETPELHAAYVAALAGCDVQLVRLQIPEELIAERTKGTRGPHWDLQTALAQAKTHQPIQDFTVTNEGSPEETAAEILSRLGWP